MLKRYEIGYEVTETRSFVVLAFDPREAGRIAEEMLAPDQDLIEVAPLVPVPDKSGYAVMPIIREDFGGRSVDAYAIYLCRNGYAEPIKVADSALRFATIEDAMAMIAALEAAQA